jgi:hypothetical protein
MTTERQKATNAQNARLSTGPRTAAGRARSSGNARAHGLTRPPDRDDVIRWFRVVMNDAAAVLVPGHGGVASAALRLAETEAALERAERAEADCVEELARLTKSRNEINPALLPADDLDDPAVLEFMLARLDDRELKEGTRILLSARRHALPRVRRQLETVRGYMRRAEFRRDRALKEWMNLKTNQNIENEPKYTP